MRLSFDRRFLPLPAGCVCALRKHRAKRWYPVLNNALGCGYVRHSFSRCWCPGVLGLRTRAGCGAWSIALTDLPTESPTDQPKEYTSDFMMYPLPACFCGQFCGHLRGRPRRPILRADPKTVLWATLRATTADSLGNHRRFLGQPPRIPWAITADSLGNHCRFFGQIPWASTADSLGNLADSLGNLADSLGNPADSLGSSSGSTLVALSCRLIREKERFLAAPSRGDL